MTHEERLAAMQKHADAPIPPRVKREDRTSLTYWFPKIEAAGLPVPKTIIVELPEDARREVWRVFDGQEMGDAAQPFFDQIKAAADSLGYPCFLRTSHTSGKHDWENTCFLRDPERIAQQVVTIIEYGEISCVFGIPHDSWAVREFLPTKPLAVCLAWSNMPVCREFRVFVNDDKVQCWHPYWPLNALQQGGAVDPDVAYVQLIECSDEAAVLALASRAGAACGGYWSVDILETERGWYVTDMAEGEQSFHWEGCAHG